MPLLGQFGMHGLAESIFTTRHHASTLYAVVMCLSICHKSVFYWNG